MISTPTSFVESLSRSQVAGAVASVIDFGVLFGLAELFHVYYVAAVAIGAFAGAVTNFWMNRHWSFRASHVAVHGQALKYSIVSGLSLVLNTWGTYFVTENLKLHYGISVLVVSFVVAILFNFPLHRYYVFK